MFTEVGSQMAGLHDDKAQTMTSSVVTCLAGNVTDPLTVNTQTVVTSTPDGLPSRERKPQVSPGTSVFIAEQVMNTLHHQHVLFIFGWLMEESYRFKAGFGEIRHTGSEKDHCRRSQTDHFKKSENSKIFQVFRCSIQ